MTASRCARPSRRARIATGGKGRARRRPGRPLRPALAPGEDRNAEPLGRTGANDRRLRPALAPGEDRNPAAFAMRASITSRAAPGPRAGRGSQLWRVLVALPAVGLRAAPGPRAGRGSQLPVCRGRGWGGGAQLRPALAPGEDRNRHVKLGDGKGELAAPGPRAGRGSQPGQGVRPQGRADAAPGPRAGRGSQLRGGVAGRTGRCDALRPALAPGEDRNSEEAQDLCRRTLALRPALAPGEDRNTAMTRVAV